MDKWQSWYSSPGSVRVTTQNGVDLSWHNLYVWAVRDDNAPSRVQPDRTERVTFDLSEEQPVLSKGSTVTVEISNMGFVGKATVLFDLPYDSRGVGNRGVQLEWVRR